MNLDMRNLLNEMEKVLSERVGLSSAAGDLKRAIDLTDEYVKDLSYLLNAAADIGGHIKNAAVSVPGAVRLQKALKDYRRRVDTSYGIYADGRTAVYSVFKAAGKKTRRSTIKSIRKTNVNALNQDDLEKNVAGILKLMSKQVKATSEYGRFWLRKANDTLLNIQNGSDDAEQVDMLLEQYMDFRDSANAAWGMMGGMVKRAERALRLVQQTAGIQVLESQLDEEQKLDMERDNEIEVV